MDVRLLTNVAALYPPTGAPPVTINRIEEDATTRLQENGVTRIQES